MKTRILGALLALPIILSACSNASPLPAPTGTSSPTQGTASPTNEPALPQKPESYQVVDAYPALTFKQPLEYVWLESSGKAYVVERGGLIHEFEDSVDVRGSNVFADLTDKVSVSATERGLLGLAFHPDHEENGLYYVNYTTERDTVIESSEGEVVMSFPQPYSNHNGGHIAFGNDGYLHIAVGDGGGAGDPQGNAQNLSRLYGKLLRIDIDKKSGSKNYSIPPDNPFADGRGGVLPEIFAYGLRNPWKFSIDGMTGKIMAGDVGQNRIEEVDEIVRGGNYGWNIMEGTSVYKDDKAADKAALIPPLTEYQHPEGKSVTGGYIYRGELLSWLYGDYVYGDFVTGRVWAYDFESGESRKILETGLNISSFGLDSKGEILVVDYSGKLFRITSKD
ncbi:PQQ-dependent sugar dehydrogenase [Youngiibacter fragilis]|uniref:Glucose sorbosone dehydrogenase n=1 Tax=Youngiibacter fragilis 232.1 TaxID=994573 RepID=V7HZZ7_9CLOT|nr:PQQ-dependent sugar dehydrogenase [Youngiibacter fragilis]ETA79560.1 glucose sorbosone dehydrogenase [Youngiibacter fragilis 232.1]